eukprot:5085398-Alexandrium_andersonii.AAC.1
MRGQIPLPWAADSSPAPPIPRLLTVRGRYRRLGGEWNCRGLGREFLDPKDPMGWREVWSLRPARPQNPTFGRGG